MKSSGAGLDRAQDHDTEAWGRRVHFWSLGISPVSCTGLVLLCGSYTYCVTLSRLLSKGEGLSKDRGYLSCYYLTALP